MISPGERRMKTILLADDAAYLRLLVQTTRGLMQLRSAPSRRRAHIISGISCLCALMLMACQGNVASVPPITIGLIAPLSGGSAASGPRGRDALELLPPFEGLVKRYAPACTPERTTRYWSRTT